MAESPTYTAAQIIALAKGTTNWYEYAKSGFQHVKNAQDDISTLQSAAFSGATPGWNAAIDTRYYVADTSSSATTYTGVTNPSATSSDSLFTGYRIFFNPATTNTGAATLNVGSSDGAVNIKKISGGTKAALSAGDLDDNGIYELTFDGTDWIMIAPPEFSSATARTWTAAQRGEITALTSATTITIDMADSNNFSVTLAHNATFANPSNLTAGQSGSIFLTQDGTGSRTASWGTNWDFAGGTAPTLTTTASAVDRVDYVVLDSSNIHAVATLNLS